MSEQNTHEEPTTVTPLFADDGSSDMKATKAAKVAPHHDSGHGRTVESSHDEHDNDHHASPRVARSAANKPLIADHDRPEENRPVRPAASAKAAASGSSSDKPRARRMSLSLTRIDAWSAAKVAFMLSVAGGIIQLIAASLLWLLLKTIGVFDQVTQIVSSSGLDAGSADLTTIFSLPTILSAVAIFAVLQIVIITILAAIGALLYNVISQMVGGLHVTLGDD